MLNITVAGRVGKDSELRFTPNGDPVLGWSVAVDCGFGESKHTTWVKCSLFGKRGEALSAYIKKGGSLTVTGRGDLRTWKTEQSSGSEITINVSEVTLQGGRQGEGDEPTGAGSSGFRNTAPAPGADKPATAEDFKDDDIPF